MSFILLKEKFLYIVLLLSLSFSLSLTKRIHRPQPDISFKGEQLLYKGAAYTGIVVEQFPMAETQRESAYKNGLLHGLQEDFNTRNGQKLASRKYRAGEKVGIHRSWFEDGKRRSHHEYRDGHLEGESWEWHHSGHPSLFTKFENGKMLGKKMWREDGKIYMNYVFTENGVYGVPGTRLCFQIRQ